MAEGGNGTARSADDELIARLMRLPDEGGPYIYQFGSHASGRQYTRLYELTRRSVPAGAEVLDWGAGVGHFSYFLAEAGYRPTAFAFEEPPLTPWFDGRVRLVRGETAEPVALPFADGSFDAVISVGVLEHVRETGGDEAASLREIERVLRPGGVLIVWHFPNRYSWIDALARAIGRAHHVYRYTPGEVRELIAGAGLELVESGRYGALPRNFLGAAPPRIRGSLRFADLWDGFDRLLSALIRPVVQNNYAVARKV